VGRRRDAIAHHAQALTYAPTGGLVAAATSSLPEQLGGTRNWDYRFCWLRDATLTLLALMNAGYYDEARDWRDWLLRAAAGAPAQLQIMYGLAGERRLPEFEIPWLPGYENSSPVRIGNGAHDQLQLDVYGEVMDAMHQARRGGLVSSEADWAFQCALLKHLESIWQQPDHGLWEGRGEPRHFTYSKVMAWVAFDRGIHAIEQFGLSGPVDHWRYVRQVIHNEVCERGFDRELGSFVQSYGSKELDASLLLLSTVGFLPPADPRITGTIAAVERRLFRDGFLLRYDTRTTDDGLPEGEGAFLACSFWLADAYVLVGRMDGRTRCASVWWRSRTTWDCCQRSTTRERAGWLATSRRPSRMSHWSTRRTTWREPRSPLNNAPRRDASTRSVPRRRSRRTPSILGGTTATAAARAGSPPSRPRRSVRQRRRRRESTPG
jgi:GH15 family glucan-1,4-alpha-glucosidase